MKAFLFTIVLALMASIARAQVLCDPNDKPAREVVKLTQIRGTIVDANGGVIPKIRVLVREGRAEGGKQLLALETNAAGALTSDRLIPGKYDLEIAGPKGFCRLEVPVEISKTGWKAFRLELPVGATDTCPSYCLKKYRIEEAEQ